MRRNLMTICLFVLLVGVGCKGLFAPTGKITLGELTLDINNVMAFERKDDTLTIYRDIKPSKITINDSAHVKKFESEIQEYKNKFFKAGRYSIFDHGYERHKEISKSVVMIYLRGPEYIILTGKADVEEFLKNLNP